MIEMQCPKCGKTLRIQDNYLGTTGKCKACLTRINVTVPPGIHKENPVVLTLEPIEETTQSTSVYCPGCRNPIPLRIPCEKTRMACERCGSIWILEKLAQQVEDEDFTSPAIRETWPQPRTRMPETL